MQGNKKNIFYVYVHRRLDDGQVFYVGKGKEDRATWKHGRSLYWNRVVAKHGFKPEIIASGLTEEQSFNLERHFIAKYKALQAPLVNLTDGGEGVSGPTEEVRQKIGSAMRGKKHTEETIAKITEAVSGDRNPSRGKTRSEATRLKISAAGFRRSPNVGIKISIANRSKTVYSFKHKNGEEFTGTRKELCDKVSLKLNTLGKLFVKNPALSVCGGWYLERAVENTGE